MTGLTITSAQQSGAVQLANQNHVRTTLDVCLGKTTHDGMKSKEIIIDGKTLYICEQKNTCWVINSNGQKITDSRDAARYLGIETTEKLWGLYTTYHKTKNIDGPGYHRKVREEYSWEGDKFKLVNSEDITPNYSGLAVSHM